jgi:hypothetical protein
MFGTDVIVIEHASLFLREDDDSAGSIGKALEHSYLLTFALAYKR